MDVEPLLTELLMARGPGGQEDEVRSICLRELRTVCDEVKVDKAGNVIGLIRPRKAVILMTRSRSWRTWMKSP